MHIPARADIKDLHGIEVVQVFCDGVMSVRRTFYANFCAYISSASALMALSHGR